MRKRGLALDIGQRLAELEAQHARLEQQGVSLGQQENEFQRFIQQAAEQLRSLRHEQSMARTQEALFGQAEARQQQGRGLAQRLTDSQQTLLQIQQRQEECRWLWQSEIHCRDQPGSFPRVTAWTSAWQKPVSVTAAVSGPRRFCNA